MGSGLGINSAGAEVSISNVACGPGMLYLAPLGALISCHSIYNIPLP